MELIIKRVAMDLERARLEECLTSKSLCISKAASLLWNDLKSIAPNFHLSMLNQATSQILNMISREPNAQMTAKPPNQTWIKEWRSTRTYSRQKIKHHQLIGVDRHLLSLQTTAGIRLTQLPKVISDAQLNFFPKSVLNWILWQVKKQN
jgi:hypothetical protein